MRRVFAYFAVTALFLCGMLVGAMFGDPTVNVRAEQGAALAAPCEARIWVNNAPTGPRFAINAAQYPEFCGAPPTATAVPPTATGVPPTATGLPPTATTVPPGGWYVPAQSVTWAWQLTGTIDLSKHYQLYDVDLFDTSAATVAAIHAQGGKAVCYLSAGTWEDWRPDADQFPASVKGSGNGWPGEKWLDIRNLSLRPIMAARLDTCKSKGFDAVEPDNIDGYANRTGFPLTAADQLVYNRWLAAEAHARGLGIALKNDAEQVGALVANFDFVIAEECVRYNECPAYSPFVAAGKAVLAAEYSGTLATICNKLNPLSFRGIKKNLDLTASEQHCWTP